MVKLATLGSMGWIPTRNRHTCCYCLEYGNKLIILDAGTGIARFDEPWAQKILQHYHKAYVILSHYHLDHAAGLIYLPHFFKDKEVHIAGPGQSIYGQRVTDILSRLIAPPYFGRPLLDFPMNLTLHELVIGANIIDNIRIDTILQEHNDPSIGIKIDNTVCYITDTACNQQTVDFVRGCKLLLHETWFDIQDYNTIIREGKSSPDAMKPLKSHSPVNRVAEIARDASVETLMLIHLNPVYDEKRLSAMEKAAKEIFPNSQLAVDGQYFILAAKEREEKKVRSRK
ncbi:MAG: MBL fold metallo-hydrolase [Candidatus Aminicenantes bacterium]|nr:MBL fold metallo-hydrolase [Candidatus Aminicenantes bacterium]NIM83752.1 MBL fold metallo-hydrolase [Candidatus Aminicenantes bacterium]NIN23212.1 MBL fold metallo-hydrolase [Candidatus Aminicenantes bacterium]NIN46906.1 MBL fold metallo-hydrolase [Candidatus Aminicenantes bacterium]NIN89828.1 MBL fold metallo-hydrolase [Candidatus Aminicenantes bacterium]